MTSTATTQRFRLDITLTGGASDGCLLRIVAVLHAASVRVEELHHRAGDGRCSVVLACDAERAAVVAARLRRCVEVVEVVDVTR